MWGKDRNRKYLLVKAITFTHFKRDMASVVTQGRAICRLVSLFQSVEELVDENDRRQSLQLDEDESRGQAIEHTLEYIYFQTVCLTTDISRQSGSYLPWI
jgi:hypothetical protein